MDPSEEKPERLKTNSPKKAFVLPAILITLLLLAIGGILSFFNSSSTPPLTVTESVIDESPAIEDRVIDQNDSDKESATGSPDNVVIAMEPAIPLTTPLGQPPPPPENEYSNENENAIPLSDTTQEDNLVPEKPSLPKEPVQISICSQPEQRLKTFYTHLDNQAYMESYHLTSSSQDHFIDLIQKLLANPPEITRESDDLYTILKNTAHFFRISGKDNIFMLQGILNSEQDKLEQILADYYLLVTTPECSSSRFAKDIDRDALYEYACFFLNTMGGRLYLFRRDSLSRMTVTYYAILLVELANVQQNNRHGIALKPAVNMLISEMERGGSSLHGVDEYLDKLYDLKEKYQ